MKILMIDNYDSFTYNLVQLIGKFTSDIIVVRNDKIELNEIIDMQPVKIVISPGPGKPEDSNISLKIIQELGNFIPVLGVCLGHQGIGISFGGRVVNAPELMHGKISEIKHNNTGIYKNIPQNFEAARYHSLIIENDSLPDVLEITSTTEDGIIMGVKHKEFPIEGIQFHPESILTKVGSDLMKNWIDQN